MEKQNTKIPGKLAFISVRDHDKPAAVDLARKLQMLGFDLVATKGTAEYLLNLGIDSYGIDISRYALDNSDKELAGRLHLGSADDLPFTDNSFDAVFSINTIHNLNKKGCIKAIKEIERVSKGKSFIQVDAYENLEQKKIFMSWVLTAKFHTYTYEWEKIFKKAGYTGCYNWTIIQFNEKFKIE